MLVLSGKKIRYVVLGMFAVFMVMAISLSSKDMDKNYIETVSLPVSGKVVVDQVAVVLATLFTHEQ